MNRKGFVLSESKQDSGTLRAIFIEKNKSGKRNTASKRSIEISIKENAKYFTLHTPEINEYVQGQQSLIKSGYFYDSQKDVNKEPSMLFQKENITISAVTQMQDSIAQYSFCLKEKVIPTELKYAEDLLHFDSHEFLASFFGEQNVKKDIYYFSEKELKKCSILFSGTPRQVVFVWGDDVYLNNLLYIMVTNILPTEGAKNTSPFAGNNEWQLKNGIHPGMDLKELLKINEADFDIYGNKSELSFLVKPNEYGKVDFKKTAILLSCHQCFDNKIFNTTTVSALDVAKANLPVQVFDIVIYPPSLPEEKAFARQ